MSHTLPFSLSWGSGSVAYFADGPADQLVIFVHGFGGKALKTWDRMDDLIDDPKAAASDIVFYGYGSLTASAHASAGIFRKMLTSAATNAENWRYAAHAAGANPDARDYDRILIIAHSLGAVVVRRTLLDLISIKAPWIDRCRLLLFGPAHMGTRLTELKKMLRSGAGSIFFDLTIFAQVAVPVLDDLAEGSGFLAKLLTDSQAAIATGVTNPVIAEQVIFGDEDNVVRVDPFASDPLLDIWQGEGHCSVCTTPGAISAVAAQL